MAELRPLIEHVGEELFERAQAWARETAAGTGTPRGDTQDQRWSEDVKDVPHELEDLIWSAATSWDQRVALAFALYRQMPAYANLMYAKHHFREWDEDARGRFWREYRSLVSDPDDRLADPVAYSLWCDYFEDPETVAEAWHQIARPDDLSPRGLARVLDVAGPVPFPMKAPLYEQLVSDRQWHEPIFRSLLHSAFDVYGDIDKRRARQLVARLSLPEETEGLAELRHRLGLA